MYYEIYYNGKQWVAYNPYEPKDNSVLYSGLDRLEVIAKVESWGYRWAGD